MNQLFLTSPRSRIQLNMVFFHFSISLAFNHFTIFCEFIWTNLNLGHARKNDSQGFQFNSAGASTKKPGNLSDPASHRFSTEEHQIVRHAVQNERASERGPFMLVRVDLYARTCLRAGCCLRTKFERPSFTNFLTHIRAPCTSLAHQSKDTACVRLIIDWKILSESNGHTGWIDRKCELLEGIQPGDA